jgi:hypothetical protein
MFKYKTILVIILIIVSLFIIFKKTQNNENYLNIGLYESSPSFKSILEKMLKDLNGLFTTYGITYWIDGPTLAQAIKNKSLNSDNYKANICLLFQDKYKLLTSINMLNQMGYGLDTFWSGYRIYPLNGVNPKYYNRQWHPKETSFNLEDREFFKYKHPFIDIFLCRQETDRGTDVFRYSDPTARRIFSNYFHLAKDVYPLREYKLDSAIVLGPNNPLPYLERNYANLRTRGYNVGNMIKTRWDPLVKGKIINSKD